MYIPKINLLTDRKEILSFMRENSFATVVTIIDDLPVANQLPFLIVEEGDTIKLKSHFAKANNQWKNLEGQTILITFSGSHAYISPKSYDSPLAVPTWNYISVHAYGQGRVISDEAEVIKFMEYTVMQYEADYLTQWAKLPAEYKEKMLQSIVAFEVTVNDLQAKEKLRQNKSVLERFRIIESLHATGNYNDRLIASHIRNSISKERNANQRSNP